MKKLNEKGITLIALVVTIVVLLILAGVSISMLTGQNGIIENASKAKKSTNEAGDLEYLQVKAYDILTDYYMKNPNTEENEYILQELGKLEGITSDVVKGTLTYNGKTYDVSEILGSTNEQNEIKANGIKQITMTTANEKEKELLENENVRMVIKEGDSTNDEETIKAVIPKGFYYVTGKPSTGLVISDKIGDDDKNTKGGNQFVWVPCNGNSKITYERTKDESTKYGLASQWTDSTKQFYYNTPQKYTDWTDYGGAKEGDNIDSVDSVQKYGGFYIARFEAGVPENATFYANSDGATNSNNKTPLKADEKTIDENVKPVSKKNNQCWNYISQKNAKIVSQNMYANSSVVSSQLVDSYAWDTTVSWLKIEAPDIGQNSIDYGNYANSNSNIKIKNTMYTLHHYVEQKNPSKWIDYRGNKRYYKGDINLGKKLLAQNDEKKYEFYSFNTEYNYTYYNHYLWVELPTGAYDTENASSEVKKIYDMAGNVYEWTTEVGNHSTSEMQIAKENFANAQNAVRRGGSFVSDGSTSIVSARFGDLETTWTGANTGFRVVLYLR